MTREEKQDHLDAILLNETIDNLKSKLNKKENSESLNQLKGELEQIKAKD